MKVAIVGGGIAGLVSAYELACAGHAAEVLERGAGGGASARALGVLVPSSLNRKIDVLQRAGVAAWPGLARRLCADAGAGEVEQILRDWGDGRGQVRLPKVFDVLTAAVRARGGKVKADTAVDKLGALKGYDRVVLAAGWGNRHFGLPLKISAGQAVRMQPPALFNRMVAEDNLFIVPDWDGTVLVGSKNWALREPGDGTALPEVTAELVARARALAPELERAEVLGAWVGYRPVSDPRLPLLRQLDGRVWAVAGLGKVGIALAPMVAAEVVRISA